MTNEYCVPRSCLGARKSARATETLAPIEEFAAANVVPACDTQTARRYVEIKNPLRLKGRPLPENNIWIAAIALLHDLTLITGDKHFAEIDGLSAAEW
jgi:tRNA(fMet)-specific endonuclease VapC